MAINSWLLACKTEIGQSLYYAKPVLRVDPYFQVLALLEAQSRQKSYTDKSRRPLEFEVGDHVYIRVSPMKGVHRFGIKEKLDHRYIGLYPIIDKYGPTSCQVELPSRLSGVHNVFHVS
jgi:hypothetical protein